MAFLIIDIFIRGFGVSLSVIANVILAVILSLVFFGSILEIREGTIIAALLTGVAVNIFSKVLTEPLNFLMTTRSIRAATGRPDTAKSAEAA